MPRKPKPLLQLDDRLRAALVLTDQYTFPKNPALLKLIAQALLYRIRQRDPKEEKFLRLFVRGVSMSEELASKHQAFRKYFGKSLVANLSRLIQKRPRPEHHVPTLRIQQTLLIDYLKSNNFQAKGVEQIKDWLHERVQEMWELIKPYPCFCNYRRTLADMDLDKPVRTETLTQLIRLILAELHFSTPENIRKLLKRPYKKLKVDVAAVKEFLRQAK